MKYFLSLLFIGAVFFEGCSKSNHPSNTPVNEIPDTASADIIFSANFTDGPNEHVTGKVKIYHANNKYSLALQDFNTSDGPDLHVYLSQEPQPIHFIELGNLKSTSGNQVYNIPGSPDFSLYTYVLIHCQEFNHVFGIATIK